MRDLHRKGKSQVGPASGLKDARQMHASMQPRTEGRRGTQAEGDGERERVSRCRCFRKIERQDTREEQTCRLPRERLSLNNGGKRLATTKFALSKIVTVLALRRRQGAAGRPGGRAAGQGPIRFRHLNNQVELKERKGKERKRRKEKRREAKGKKGTERKEAERSAPVIDIASRDPYRSKVYVVRSKETMKERRHTRSNISRSYSEYRPVLSVWRLASGVWRPRIATKFKRREKEREKRGDRRGRSAVGVARSIDSDHTLSPFPSRPSRRCMSYSLHVCLAGERMLCLHASRIPASAQYITEPMKTREIRTRLAIVRHINTRMSLARGTNTTVTPCRCTSGRPYCRLGIPTPYHPPARTHARSLACSLARTHARTAHTHTHATRTRARARANPRTSDTLRAT